MTPIDLAVVCLVIAALLLTALNTDYMRRQR